MPVTETAEGVLPQQDSLGTQRLYSPKQYRIGAASLSLEEKTDHELRRMFTIHILVLYLNIFLIFLDLASLLLLLEC